MDAAAAAHGGALGFVPAEMVGTMYEPMVQDGLSGLGITPTVSGGAEFFALMTALNSSLSDPASELATMASSMAPAADGTTVVAQLQASFARFDADLNTTPANGYLSLYTPARLKAQLQRMGLVATPVVDAVPLPTAAPMPEVVQP
jgi:hypothetical protein